MYIWYQILHNFHSNDICMVDFPFAKIWQVLLQQCLYIRLVTFYYKAMYFVCRDINLQSIFVMSTPFLLNMYSSEVA